MPLAEEPKEDLHLLKPKLNLGKRTFKYSGSAHLEHGVTFFLWIFNEYSRFLIFCTFKLLHPVFLNYYLLYFSIIILFSSGPLGYQPYGWLGHPGKIKLTLPKPRRASKLSFAQTAANFLMRFDHSRISFSARILNNHEAWLVKVSVSHDSFLFASINTNIYFKTGNLLTFTE